jgi:hypothetical protein
VDPDSWNSEVAQDNISPAHGNGVCGVHCRDPDLHRPMPRMQRFGAVQMRTVGIKKAFFSWVSTLKNLFYAQPNNASQLKTLGAYYSL